jgi:hypothetical protein
MSYKWTTIMTVQGNSISFCLSFLSLNHYFCWFIPYLSQRLYKPKSPYRTKRKTSTSMLIWLFIFYLLMNQTILSLWRHFNGHAYTFSFSSSVKQLGYGDAGNMYGVQGSGPRAGAKFNCFDWFILFFKLCYLSVYWCLSFFFPTFQLDIHRWVFFS